MSQINMMFIGTLVFFQALTIIDAQNRCTDGSVNCINIRNCPEILSILNGPRPLSEQARQFIRNSHCGFEGTDPKVCCNEQATPSTIPQTISQTIPAIREITTEIPEIDLGPPNVTNHPNLRLLDHASCGPVYQQRVFGGNTTEFFEYPWMALIAYDTGGPNPKFRCGGTVISSRYILTAAHCVTSLPAGFRVISIRVGDHDISTEQDCEVDNHGRKVFCSEMYQDIAVESVHFHPEYNREGLQNDIGLIRLNSSVDFHPRNAKPICLPFGNSVNLTKDKATVTGWGATEKGPSSQTLLQAKLPLVAYESCKEAYSRTKKIWYKQLCAGGQLNINSCLGDSGGPLQADGIYIDTSMRIIQYGIVSYGHLTMDSYGLIQCGIEGFPGVYTKVAYYMDWILDTMTD